MKFISKVKARIKAHHRALYGALVLLPATSHATGIQSVLDKAAVYLSGPLARSVGIIAIIGAGYLCLFQHKFPKEQFVWILVGLGIIFGAAALYNLLVY